MITLKSLMPYLGEIEGKKILFFFNQEDSEIYSFEDIDQKTKETLKEMILSQIYDQKIENPSFDLEIIEEIDEKIEEIKEQEYDSGKYEHQI